MRSRASEWLVHDDVQSRTNGLECKRDMGSIRRRDHSEVQIRRVLPERVGGIEDRRSGMRLLRILMPIAVAGYDRREMQARRRLDQGRMKNGARKPVTYQSNAKRLAWKRR